MKKQYVPRHRYSAEELEQAARADLLADAECAEKQAKEGPFYPALGITAESLLKHAENARALLREAEWSAEA